MQYSFLMVNYWLGEGLSLTLEEELFATQESADKLVSPDASK